MNQETPALQPPSFHPSPTSPRLRLPAGACDAHCHVFGPQRHYPFAQHRMFTPSAVPGAAERSPSVQR